MRMKPGQARARRWACVMLASSLVMTPSAGAVGHDPAEYLEQTVARGLSPIAALEALAIRFPAPADRVYLNTLKSDAPAFARGKPPKKYRAIRDGYEITADNGRTYTLTATPKAVRLNGRDLTKDLGGAERFVRAVDRALKISFVTRAWLPSLWPTAEAASLKVEALMIAAAGLAAIALFVLKPGSDFDYLKTQYDSFEAMCRRERASHEFDGSSSMTLHSLWTGSGVFKEDGSEQNEACETLVETAVRPFGRRFGRQPKLDRTQRDYLCLRLKQTAQCLRLFAATEAAPVPAPPAPPTVAH